MPLLNASPLALPDNADVAGAYQDAVLLKAPGPGQYATRITPGETYEQLLTATFSYLTSAAAGSRTIVVVVNDPNGNEVGVYPGNQAQGPGTSAIYSVNGQNGQTYSTVTGDQVIGMPQILLLPGYELFFGSPQRDAADSVSSVACVFLRVPTGAPKQAPSPLLASPLQV